MSREQAASVLDDLFSQVESMQTRVRETLGEEEPATPPAPRPEQPRVRLPGSRAEAVLDAAVDAAVAIRATDAVLARMFGDGEACATRGLAPDEVESYAVGPPPVGPRVRALAIAYDADAGPDGEAPIQMALAVPILSGDETIGFLSIFTRSPEVVFDEQQGWELQAIATAVQQAIEAPAVAPEPAEEPSPSSPRLRTALLLAAGAACIAAPVLMAAGIHSGLRVAAALALMALAPGMAAWPLFGSRSAPLELGLVIGTSLGVSALVAELTLWAGVWSPARSTAVLAAVSLASILAQLMRRTAWSHAALGEA